MNSSTSCSSGLRAPPLNIEEMHRYGFAIAKATGSFLKIAELEKQVQQLTSVNNLFHTIKRDQDSEIVRLKQENAFLQATQNASLESLRVRCSEFQASMSHLDSERTHLLTIKRDQDSEIVRLRQENSSLQGHINYLESEKIYLSNINQNKDAEIERLRQENIAFLDAHKGSYDQYEVRLMEMQERMNRLESENRRLQQIIDQYSKVFNVSALT